MLSIHLLLILELLINIFCIEYGAEKRGDSKTPILLSSPLPAPLNIYEAIL